MNKISKYTSMLAIPVIAFALAGCGALQFDATCSNGHCNGTAGPVTSSSTPAPDNSVSASASVPGAEPSSPAPTVTVTQYVPVVQSCLPDPTESQLEALQNGAPSCLDLNPQEQQVFVTVIVNELNQTPRSEFHSQQGRDDWRDHEIANAVQQAHQQS